jgi:predicted transcriptional regulator
MVGDDARQIVLLSIKPRFADAIIAGAKRVEFRRTRCRPGLDTAIIYVTAPTKKILGYFEVTRVEEMSPVTAWRRYGEVGGISRMEFDRYYAGAARAVVISVGRVVRLPFVRHLGALGARYKRPPQSLQYVPLRLDPEFLGAKGSATPPTMG